MKVLSIILSSIISLPCVLSFFSFLKWIKLSWFDEFFCYASRISLSHGSLSYSTEMLYEKFFIDMLSLYGVFLCATQFGMALVNENKKSSIMSLISIIQLFILIFCFKQSLQYRYMFMFFFILASTIIEKLYEVSGMISRHIFKTRIVVNIILCCMSMYMMLV